MDGKTSVVIHKRRFWWRHPDGKLEPIHMGNRARGQLHQTRSTEAREERKEAGA